MKVFNGIVASAYIAAISLAAWISRAADLELLPGASVRLGIGASSSQRIAVDVSSNLVNWMQLTNAAAAGGQITFANDPSVSDPMRFFRISDGDDTFAVAGIVDGGQFFGGMAGATVTESATGTSVKTEANGFFHFDHRFSRTNLPITLTATFGGGHPVQRRITVADAGTLSVIQFFAAPTPLEPADTAFHFKVSGGPRAGLEYTMRFYDSWVEITGGISGQGVFSKGYLGTPTLLMTNSVAGTSVLNQFFFWSGGTNDAGPYGWFSGIPSTNGTLAGNGIVTLERVTVSPESLDGLAFSIGAGEIQFMNSQYTLKWDGAVRTDNYRASRDGNFWHIDLDDGSTYRIFQLYFLTATNGSFLLETPTSLVVGGEMHQIAFTPDVVYPPTTLSTLNVTTTLPGGGENVQYTVIFSGGDYGSFTKLGSAGVSVGSGTYTYSVSGGRAHLMMSYEGFGGDFDSMTLVFKAGSESTTPSSFTGTQRVDGTDYQFTGTFIYNEIAPDVPASLSGLAFSVDTGRVQFTNNIFALTWNGTDYTGTFTAVTNENTWQLTLAPQIPIQTTVTLILSFNAKTNGTYTMDWPGQPIVTGTLNEIAYVPPPPDNGVPAPATLSNINVTTGVSGIGNGVQYTVTFVGGTSGAFSEQVGDATYTGSYTYTVDGSHAHLYMVYPQFPGDYDDMTLNFEAPAGSATPSSFIGTQSVGGNVYQFTGTFTY